MRRRWFALALTAGALSGTGCFRLCERWFGPNCCGGCCAPGEPRREAPAPRPGEERIPPAALPSAPRPGGAPPTTLPPVPTGTGAYGGT